MSRRFEVQIGLLAFCTVLFSSLVSASSLSAQPAKENSFVYSACFMLFDINDSSVKQVSCDLPVTFNVFQQEDAKVVLSAELTNDTFATGVPKEVTHVQELPQEISGFVQSSFAFYSSISEELSKCTEKYCTDLLTWIERGEDHANHFVKIEHDMHVFLERRKPAPRHIYIGCGEHGVFALIERPASTRGNFGAISAEFVPLTNSRLCDAITSNM